MKYLQRLQFIYIPFEYTLSAIVHHLYHLKRKQLVRAVFRFAATSISSQQLINVNDESGDEINQLR